MFRVSGTLRGVNSVTWFGNDEVMMLYWIYSGMFMYVNSEGI